MRPQVREVLTVDRWVEVFARGGKAIEIVAQAGETPEETKARFERANGRPHLVWDADGLHSLDLALGELAEREAQGES